MEATPLFLRGSRRDIGRALGDLARPHMAELLAQSTTWFALQRWRNHALLDSLAQMAQQHLPRQWEELCGLAEGLDMPLADVLLWNVRGDLLHHTDDGCMTIALRHADGSRWIAHNEDGDPFLTGKGRLIDIQTEDAPGFLFFYLPGSLPGFTFAANRAGLVQVIDNLRIMRGGKGVPRALLARALLDCRNLDDAQGLLSKLPRAGGFHHLLGAVGDERLLSIEATPERCSTQPITTVYGHTNHCIHFGARQTTQLITTSSRERLERLDVLLLELNTRQSAGLGALTEARRGMSNAAPQAALNGGGDASIPGQSERFNAQEQEQDLLRVLYDTDATLPLLRTDLCDPDGENTLASVIFRLDDEACRISVYDRGLTPIFQQRF